MTSLLSQTVYRAIVLAAMGLVCFSWNHVVENGATQEEVPARELFEKARAMILDLEAISQKRSLTRKDTESTWAIVYRMGSAKDCKYEDQISLYGMMNKLNLPPGEKLDTIRMLGQRWYLAGKYDKASAIFSQALDLSTDKLTADEKQNFYRYFGNVMLMNARSLEKLGDDEASLKTFRRVSESRDILANIPQTAVASTFSQMGEILFQRKDFANAIQAFQAGLKHLKEHPDVEADDRYRIGMEIGVVKSTVMESNPEKPDYKELLDELDKLRDKFETKSHPRFDLILRTRVIVAGNLDEKDLLVEMATELRDFYVEKHSVVGELGDSKYYFLDCSALLVKHLYAEGEKKEAREMLQETKSLADPRKSWFNKFPKALLEDAFANSVLDKDIDPDK